MADEPSAFDPLFGEDPDLVVLVGEELAGDDIACEEIIALFWA